MPAATPNRDRTSDHKPIGKVGAKRTWAHPQQMAAKSAQLTYNRRGACKRGEWQLRRAALQHPVDVINGSFGPFASILSFGPLMSQVEMS